MIFHDFPSSSHDFAASVDFPLQRFSTEKKRAPSLRKKEQVRCLPRSSHNLTFCNQFDESLCEARSFSMSSMSFFLWALSGIPQFFGSLKNIYLNHVKQLSVIKKSISYSPTIHPTKSHEMTVKYGTWSGSAAWDLASFDLWRMFPGAVAGMWPELYDEEWGI